MKEVLNDELLLSMFVSENKAERALAGIYYSLIARGQYLSDACAIIGKNLLNCEEWAKPATKKLYSEKMEILNETLKCIELVKKELKRWGYNFNEIEN